MVGINFNFFFLWYRAMEGTAASIITSPNLYFYLSAGLSITPCMYKNLCKYKHASII